MRRALALIVLLAVVAAASAFAAGARSSKPVATAARQAPVLTVTGDLTPLTEALRPGMTRQAAVELAASAAMARLSVSGTAPDEPLARVLRLRIEDATGRVAYDGVVAGLRTASLAPLAAGERRRYRVTVTFPDGGSADNGLQGSSAGLRLRWTGESATAAASRSVVAPPTIRLVAARRRVLRSVRVTIRCHEACTATAAVVRRRPGQRTLVLARRSRKLARAGRATLAVPAPRRRARGLAVRRVRVTASVRDRSGRTRRLSRVVRLRYRLR